MTATNDDSDQDSQGARMTATNDDSSQDTQGGRATATNDDSSHDSRGGRATATSGDGGQERHRTGGEAGAKAADLLLRMAGRHWPVELREPLLREWRAELATLARDTERRPASRSVRQLRFALSLATSPPAKAELVFNAGRALQPVLMLLAVPLLCHAVTFGLADAVEMLLFDSVESPSWAYRMVSIAGLVLAAALLGLAGGWLGRRLPAPRAALVAPLALGAGFAAIGWAQWASLPDDPGDGSVVTFAPMPVAASLWWGVGLAALGAIVVRLKKSRLRKSRWPTAAIGGLLVFEVAGALAGRHMAPATGLPRSDAPRWFLESFTYHHLGDTMPMVVSQTLWPLLVGTAFVAGYATRARSAPRPVVEPVAVASGHQRLGLGVVAAGLALWACASILLPGRIDAVSAVDEVLGWELMLWAHELRQAAIVVAVLGLVVALAGRAAVWPAALFAGAALLVADAVVDRSGRAEPIVLGAGIVAAAWWLVGALPARAGGARRHLAAVAVVAAFCAPGPFFQVGWHGTVPAAFPVLTGVAVATALTVAGLAALAARPRPVRPVTRVAVVAAPVVLAVALVTVGFGYAIALGLPFVAYYLAVLAPDRSRFARVATPVAAAVLAVPVAYSQLMPAQLFGKPLMAAAGYGTPVDGLPFFPGVMVVAIPLASSSPSAPMIKASLK